MTPFPLVVDIKKCSFEDGPGIRSVVFFKGCPLKCVFCHNPETQNPRMEIGFDENDCIGCGSCLKVCDRGAIDLHAEGRILREKCDLCGKCARVCPGSGLRVVGKYFDVDSLAEVLLRDLGYYENSGGGVTLSGGECTMFPHYLEKLLIRLKRHRIHIAIQTCGYFNYRTFRERILPHVDLIYFDVKVADPRAHMEHIGRPNDRILTNFRLLARDGGVELHPRIPLVPSITATPKNICDIVRFLKDAGAQAVSLLPYNPLGLQKYPSLGRPVPDLPLRFMRPHELKQAYETLAECARGG